MRAFGTGAPAKGKKRRPFQLVFFVSEEERAMIRQLANDQGVPASALIRAYVLEMWIAKKSVWVGDRKVVPPAAIVP